MERKCKEAAAGCEGGNGGDLSGSSSLFLLHEWGEGASSSGVATAGQIQILISEYESLQCKGATAASEVSCWQLRYAHGM